jgi:MFS family permease
MPFHTPSLGGTLALRVFACFASAYFLSYAFRAINAVIAPALMADLGLSNADLGLLSSAYFISFASMQLPLGVWLDKYGARKTESALLLIAAAGAAMFAMGTSLLELWIGRALIGVGVSACLMAPFKAYRQWYARERQSQLASWMLVAGTSGALAATIPVTAAMPFVGWRGVFWIMSGMILLTAAAIFFLLKKVEMEVAAQADAARKTASSASAQRNPHAAGEKGGYARIFGNLYFRRLALLGTINQGTFIALQTLWAGPWMMTVLGMNRDQTSQILFVFNFCLLLSYLALSWWGPRHVSHDSNKRGWPVLRVITFSLAGSIAVQIAMIMISAPWSWMLWIALGVFATVMTLAQTQVTLTFPPSLSGHASTAYNLMVFSGAFAAQWGLGVLIDIFEKYGYSPADAMRAAFGVFVALGAAALLYFTWNRSQLEHAHVPP